MLSPRHLLCRNRQGNIDERRYPCGRKNRSSLIRYSVRRVTGTGLSSFPGWKEHARLLSRKKNFVPILYREVAFEAFDDFSDFLESISYETSKSCQVRGSNPCRGANFSRLENMVLLGSQIASPVISGSSSP